jgi:hypothetical protein
VKGRAGAGIIPKLKGYASGYGIWPLHAVIEHMSSPRELRALGEVLKPNAHELAKRLLRVAADPQRNEGDPVLVPPFLLSEAVLLLLALAGPRRGRPPKETTLQVLQLLAEGQTKRGAARAVSGKTGEPHENLRRRTRPKKPDKPKRKRGT